MTIDERALSAIHALWDELSDYDAARVEDARKHLLTSICTLIDAQNATWIGAVRLSDPHPEDPVNGWRPRALRRLHTLPLVERKSQEQVVMLDAGQVDVTTIANVAGAGSFRVNLIADLAPADWFESDYYKAYYLGIGYRDAIWAGIPINKDAEVYFGFYRGADRPMFGAAERDIVAGALRGLRWFHRLQMLGEGVSIANAPLTPAERRILGGLLRGLTEKQIAAANGQSQHTTHDHVKRIFRKYGVTSRSALMALWLGKP